MYSHPTRVHLEKLPPWDVHHARKWTSSLPTLAGASSRFLRTLVPHDTPQWSHVAGPPAFKFVPLYMSYWGTTSWYGEQSSQQEEDNIFLTKAVSKVITSFHTYCKIIRVDQNWTIKIDVVNSVYLNPRAMSTYAGVHVAMDGAFHFAAFAPRWSMSSTTNILIGASLVNNSSQLRCVERCSFIFLWHANPSLNEILNTH